jgi:hypothetical protein
MQSYAHEYIVLRHAGLIGVASDFACISAGMSIAPSRRYFVTNRGTACLPLRDI